MRILACAQDGGTSSLGWGPYFLGMDFLGGEVSSSMTTSSCLDLNLNHDQNKDNLLTFMLVARAPTFLFFSFSLFLLFF